MKSMVHGGKLTHYLEVAAWTQKMHFTKELRGRREEYSPEGGMENPKRSKTGVSFLALSICLVIFHPGKGWHG